MIYISFLNRFVTEEYTTPLGVRNSRLNNTSFKYWMTGTVTCSAKNTNDGTVLASKTLMVTVQCGRYTLNITYVVILHITFK